MLKMVKNTLRFRFGNAGNMYFEDGKINVRDKFTMQLQGEAMCDINGETITFTNNSRREFTVAIFPMDCYTQPSDIHFKSDPKGDIRDKYSMYISDISILDYSNSRFNLYNPRKEKIRGLTLKMYGAHIRNVDIDFRDADMESTILECEHCTIFNEHSVRIGINTAKNVNKITDTNIVLTHCSLTAREKIIVGVGAATNYGEVSNTIINLTGCEFNENYEKLDILIGIGCEENAETVEKVNLIMKETTVNNRSGNISIGIGCGIGQWHESSMFNINNVVITLLNCGIYNDNGDIYIGINSIDNIVKIHSVRVSLIHTRICGYKGVMTLIGIGSLTNSGEINDVEMNILLSTISTPRENQYIGIGCNTNKGRIQNATLDIVNSLMESNDNIIVGTSVLGNFGLITDMHLQVNENRFVGNIVRLGIGMDEYINSDKIHNSDITFYSNLVKYQEQCEIMTISPSEENRCIFIQVPFTNVN